MNARNLARWSVLVSVVALWAAPAFAFNGPYSTLVDVGGGVMVDTDVRWPDVGSPPPAGWPVIIFAHGGGGSKASWSGPAGDYADSGYVTLTWTSPHSGSSAVPSVLAADVDALKTWLVNDFETEAGVTAPVDSASFGMTGNSLGGATTWSASLFFPSNFATIVPRNWAVHGPVGHWVANGSIERQSAAPVALANFPALEYPATETAAAIAAVIDPMLAVLPTLTIPVFNQMAMLDSRSSGTVALSDHLALTSASQRMIYLGTGGHSTPNDDAAFRDDMMERWFDFHLKGEPTGIDTEDPVQMALLVTNEKLPLPSWPPPDQQTAMVYLHQAGELLVGAPTGAQTEDTFINDPGTFTWFDGGPDFSSSTIRNNVPQEIVAYQTAPLTEEVLLVGQPSVTLHLEGTASRYQANVHLYDLPPASDKVLLSFGTVTTSASPATETVTLSVTGRRLPAGHSLRLEITNRDDQDVDHSDGYQPQSGQLRYTPFFEHSTTRVFHDVGRPSSLSVPLIGRSDLPVGGGGIAGCPASAHIGCRVAEKSTFDYKDNPIDLKDQLSFKWTRGQSTSQAEFADPLATAQYDLCIYGAGGAVLGAEFNVPADAVKWKAAGAKGYKYKDNALVADGTQKIVLRGSDVDKSKVIWKGKGTSLPEVPPAYLPIPGGGFPIVVQVSNSDTGVCFETSFGSVDVVKNEADRLKLKQQ